MKSELINVFIACGAGASSTFLAFKLRSIPGSRTSSFRFIPSALTTLNARESDLVLVAAHIAHDATVAKLRKAGIAVIQLPEKAIGGFNADEALKLINDHLERQITSGDPRESN